MPSLNMVEAVERPVTTAAATAGKSEPRQRLEKTIEEHYPCQKQLVIPHDNVIEGARPVVAHFFPDWPIDQLTFRQFTHGITNKLVHCRHPDGAQSCLIRVYGRGSEALIDRGQEVVNLYTLARAGFAPPLYGRIKNGIVYGYTAGRPFSVDDMSDPSLSLLVARHLARWHTVAIPGDRAPTLFSTLHQWLAQVPESYDDPAKTAYMREHLSLPKIRSELEMLQQTLEQLGAPLVFGHNDLLSGNIILCEDGASVAFIDYEYANYTYRGFDIANHFCEYAGFDCDYSKYPSREHQLRWLAEYLKVAKGSDAQPAQEEVEALYVEVSKFALASHFYWAVWALVQAKISDIDFNYLEYAVLRFNEYHRLRDRMLAL